MALPPRLGVTGRATGFGVGLMATLARDAAAVPVAPKL
jgi:hypothetical protein